MNRIQQFGACPYKVTYGMTIISGSIDWACASTTSTSATAKNLVAELGTLPAKYAPPECR